MEQLLFEQGQINLSLSGLAINLSLGLALGLLLKKHFLVFSNAMSGKRELANVIPFLVLIVCLIISIVKSSLALSLGLVGALSIVRFRTPIKEPEELVYLFMAIAMGLGLGADQILATVVASLMIMVFAALIRWRDRERDMRALYLNLEVPDSSSIERIRATAFPIIGNYCRYFDISRLDSSAGGATLTLRLDVRDASAGLALVEELSTSMPAASITVIDQSRIPGV